MTGRVTVKTLRIRGQSGASSASAFFEPSVVGGYDDDPNAGGAPASLQDALVGSWYRQTTVGKWWRKTMAAAGTWEEQNRDRLGNVGRQTITHFVRSGGSDFNDGRSALTAFATLPRAMAEWKDDDEGYTKQVIDVTGTTLSGADVLYRAFPKGARRAEFDTSVDLTDAKQHYFNMSFELRADPVFDREITVIGSTFDPTTGMPDVTTVSDTLVVDELAGKTIWFGTFLQATVQSNTVSTITMASYAFPFAPIPNGTYRVYEQSCTMSFGDGSNFEGSFFSVYSSAVFNGIKFLDTATGAGGVGVGISPHERIWLNWCYFDGGLRLEETGKFVTMWDCYMRNGNFQLDCPYDINGGVFDNVDIITHGSTGAGRNRYTFSMFQACSALGGGNFEQNTDMEVENSLIQNAPGDGIRLEAPFNARFNDLRIKDCVGSAIAIHCGGGSTKLRNIVGTGNSRYGCELLRGGQAIYQFGVGLNTVDGALGEVKVGGLDARLWTQMPAIDDDSDAPQGCRVHDGPAPLEPRVSPAFVADVSLVSATPNALVARRLARYDTTAGTIVANLPLAASVPANTVITVMNEVGANNVDVTRAGADTINSVAGPNVVAPGVAIQLISNGITNWTAI